MRHVLLAISAAIAFSASAFAAVDNTETVGDKSKNIVRNSFGNCVRTKWDGKGDPCAPKTAEAPKPVPAPAVVAAPARELSKEARTVYFDFNKAAIVEVERAKLDSLSGVLKADKSVRGVRIVGFADRMGTADYNKRLSEKRAKAVESYLRSRGYLNVSGVETRWLGASVPKVECADSLKRAEKIACLREDRRVEVEIDYVK